MLLIHLASACLIISLLALAVIDHRTYRLPNFLTLPLIAAGIAFNTHVMNTPLLAIAGAAVGYGALFALEVGYRKFRGIDAIGRGDAKLLAAGGAWCTVYLVPHIALIGSATALITVLVRNLVQKRGFDGREAIAFGPWLALGAAACWIYRVYIGTPFPI